MEYLLYLYVVAILAPIIPISLDDNIEGWQQKVVYIFCIGHLLYFFMSGVAVTMKAIRQLLM